MNIDQQLGIETYSEVGGLFGCKRGCEIKHVFNASRRNACKLDCHRTFAEYKEERDTIKNQYGDTVPTDGGGGGFPGTGGGGNYPPPGGSGAGQQGMGAGTVIGISLAAVAVLGIAGYFVFKN